EKNTIIIAPDLFSLPGKGPFDYTLDVKPVPLAEKPLLDVNDELVAADPPFKGQFDNRPHHKSYALKLKAKQFVVIDMKEGKGLDHYLYLLDKDGKTVAQDDDGGGF